MTAGDDQGDPRDPAAAARLLAYLVSVDADAVMAGRRALMISYLAKLPNAPRTQRELALRLNLSPARVNVLLAEAANDLREFGAAG